MRTALALAMVLTVGLAACSSCQPSPPSPPVPAPTGSGSRAAVVYIELVAADCVYPGDGGVAAVAEEYARDGGPPAWLQCLYNGGTVADCKVPCSK